MAFWSKTSKDDKKTDAKAELGQPRTTKAPTDPSPLTAPAPQPAVGARRDSAAVSDASHAGGRDVVPRNEPILTNASAGPNAADAKRRAARSARQFISLGKIVSVLMRHSQFRQHTLADVEGLVVPAVLHDQFLIAEAQSKESELTAPVAVALWASVSAEIDHRLCQDLDQPFRLAANEWKSGDIAWLVALAGDARVINPLLKQLQETTLKGRPLKMRGKGKDGKAVVGTFTPNVSQATLAKPQQ